MLAHHAKFWWRLRAGLVTVAALGILAGLGNLAQSAVNGQVQESVRKALWVLGALLVSVVLYRLMSLADLVAQLRERIARQNHRIHLLEATLRLHGSPVPAVSPLELTSDTFEGSPTIMLTATACEPEVDHGFLYPPLVDQRNPPHSEAPRAVPGPPLASGPSLAPGPSPVPGASLVPGPSLLPGRPLLNEARALHEAGDEEGMLELCREFRAAVAERNLIEALRVGRLLRHRFPLSRRAHEFDAIEPVLQARLRAEPAPPSKSSQRA
ncbi:MAG: hypothetical protein IT449_18205 [Phycisphaerales bacterium]|nr:hypothetical protein [Phycisphaerales bacterium]